MRIEIDKEIDELNKEQFVFWFNEDRETIWLDGYYIMQRKTKRSKYRVLEKYDRLRDRESTIAMNDVPLTDEIKQRIKDETIKIISRFEVKFWSRN